MLSLRRELWQSLERRLADAVLSQESWLWPWARFSSSILPSEGIFAKVGCSPAKRFFRKALNAVHTQQPRVINVDKNAAYPKAMDELKEKEELSKQVELRQNKYLNNMVEQDHRFIKRLVKPGIRFGSSNTARRTIRGYEIMNMLRKGQVEKVEKGAVVERIKFIAEIFGVAS